MVSICDNWNRGHDKGCIEGDCPPECICKDGACIYSGDVNMSDDSDTGPPLTAMGSDDSDTDQQAANILNT